MHCGDMWLCDAVYHHRYFRSTVTFSNFHWQRSGELRSEFVHTVKQYMPELLQKQKTHLAFHLFDSMIKYGPCSAFSAKRYVYRIYYYAYICYISFRI